MNILLVIDMQNDFVTGALGTKEAQAIVPIVEKIVSHFDGEIIFTQDTHYENYLDTLEGKHLPVKHCIESTHGHAIVDVLKPYAKKVLKKETFGSFDIIKACQGATHIYLCGICTDICVISSALLLKAAYPETEMTVFENACAGVSVEAHCAALTVLKNCHINLETYFK